MARIPVEGSTFGRRLHDDSELSSQPQLQFGFGPESRSAGAHGGVSSQCGRGDHRRAAGARLVPGQRPAAAEAFVSTARDVRRQLRLPLGPEPVDGGASDAEGAAPRAAGAGSTRATSCSTSAATTRRSLKAYSDDGPAARRHRSDRPRSFASTTRTTSSSCPTSSRRAGIRARLSSNAGEDRHVDRDVLRPGATGRVRAADRVGPRRRRRLALRAELHAVDAAHELVRHDLPRAPRVLLARGASRRSSRPPGSTSST